MKRVIIFEGCDRTGKSTCIENLANNFKSAGYFPYIFHLMGPNKFEGYSFNNDQKSLLQLGKFDDEYYIFEQILKTNQKNIIILDRSHFGEFVWTEYWSRTGKYRQVLDSDGFYNKHKEIFKQIIYVQFYLSEVNKLAKRIKESPEDLKIFTINNKTIEQNILYVYELFRNVKKIVEKLNIEYIDFDNSGTLDQLNQFTIKLFQKALK